MVEGVFGGDIMFETSENEGTVFIVRLDPTQLKGDVNNEVLYSR